MNMVRIGGRAAVLVAGLALLCACGGGKPKQANEPKWDETAEPSTPQDKGDPAETTSGTEPAGDTDTDTPAVGETAEPPCKHDISKPIESTMGSIRVTGCISPASVADSIKYKWPAVFECYQQARKADPKAKGTVEIRIGVGKKGVRSVQVPRSEIPSDDFIRCVIDELRDASMPKPEQDTAMVLWTAKF